MQNFDKHYTCESHDENRNTHNSCANDVCTLRPDLEFFFPFLMLEDLQEQFFTNIF